MDFPLIRELGLKINGDYHPENKSRTVYCEDLERVLEQGVRLYRYKSGNDDPRRADWSPQIDEDFGGVKKYSHQGLLIGIKPLKSETAEDLLREFVKIRTDNIPTVVRLDVLLERALALLEKSDGK